MEHSRSTKSEPELTASDVLDITASSLRAAKPDGHGFVNPKASARSMSTSQPSQSPAPRRSSRR